MPDPIPVASSYTPAAGYHFLTPFYDFGVAVTTRERVWRDRLVHHMALAEGDVILDIGSGTGNLALAIRSEEHTSELQSLMRLSSAVFCLKKKTKKQHSRSKKCNLKINK